ncbi:hypothetical protein [Sphingomonas changnyeongensis]|uniref:hypothetical protein n=1 Tax=Sphingomonas changnyeongensis TaxID=2698679 RepID=UPI001E3F9BD8|nr:hypothetical protein [Sphingomonas changnyeongensis]
MFRRLPAGEARLLALLAAGTAFGAACERCGADAGAIGRWLAGWLRIGLVVPRA